MSSQRFMESDFRNRQTCPWEVKPSPPELPCGELHLWWMPLSAAQGVTEELCSLLSEGEAARAGRFRFDRHRNAYILARGMLRRLLQGYTGIPARDLVFRTGPLGKPALDGEDNGNRLSFNYSDAGGYALYGFIRNSEIGVDLENLDREVSYEGIANRKFSKTEADAILSLPEPMQRAAFLACWTRKEGYGKAEGWGIHYTLDSVELCKDCSNERLVLEGTAGESGGWSLRQIYPTLSFVGCVVYPTVLDQGKDLEFRYFRTSPG
jgi:4'-phosphopantetheinyl transferase